MAGTFLSDNGEAQLVGLEAQYPGAREQGARGDHGQGQAPPAPRSPSTQQQQRQQQPQMLVPILEGQSYSHGQHLATHFLISLLIKKQKTNKLKYNITNSFLSSRKQKKKTRMRVRMKKAREFFF